MMEEKYSGNYFKYFIISYDTTGIGLYREVLK